MSMKQSRGRKKLFFCNYSSKPYYIKLDYCEGRRKQVRRFYLNFVGNALTLIHSQLIGHVYFDSHIKLLRLLALS